MQRLPDVEKLARELTGKTQIKIVIDRILALKIGQIARLAKNNLFLAHKILARNFAVGIRLLCELEILASNDRKKEYMLHSQMTDMAVAFGNIDVIVQYLSLMRTYRKKASLETNNPEKLLKLLAVRHLDKEDLTIRANLRGKNYLKPLSVSGHITLRDLGND